MKVGDQVVCVTTAYGDKGHPEFNVIKGQIYTIKDKTVCPQCKLVWFDIGYRTKSGPWSCECTHYDMIQSPIVWANSRLFAPIVYNSAQEELANKKVVEEKLDVPIKETEKT